MARIDTTATAQTASAAHPPASRTSAFRQFLSELNPLQYIPVIGTLYRAATHDTIPETAREAGSLVVSFLTGGPAGAAIAIGAMAVEKAIGIDPERLGQQALHNIGLGSDADTVSRETAVHVTETAIATPAAPAPPAPRAWSASELAAYGVTKTKDNDLQRGTLTGSDVLNDLELSRQKTSA